jgi:hypothetical protein
MDVASFANSGGGLLVIGAKTERNSSGQDIIVGANGCRPGSLNVGSYFDSLQHYIVPPPQGISVELVNGASGDLLLISVPPQSDTSIPFIVRGGVIDHGKYLGSSVTIPWRRGDRTWTTPAETIHAMLKAYKTMSS